MFVQSHKAMYFVLIQIWFQKSFKFSTIVKGKRCSIIQRQLCRIQWFNHKYRNKKIHFWFDLISSSSRIKIVIQVKQSNTKVIVSLLFNIVCQHNVKHVIVHVIMFSHRHPVSNVHDVMFVVINNIMMIEKNSCYHVEVDRYSFMHRNFNYLLFAILNS